MCNGGYLQDREASKPLQLIDVEFCLDVIVPTSIFKCIFFVAFIVGKQRNVEIDYHKCTKVRHSSIKKEG
jgi:hypothetical protein